MLAGSVGGGKAIPKVTSVPSSPGEGDMIELSLTGRKVVMLYDGSNWIPLHSLGTMAMYVDGGSGTDSPEKGTGSGSNAFATVQYAIDTIPATVGGNVTINIASGTYTENVVIQGKGYTGPYSITLIGTLSLQVTASSATVAEGSGATQGTVTSVGDFGAYDDMLVHLETDDLWWLIDSDTADVLTLVSAANNSSTVTQDAKVYDWGTIIDGTADTALTISTGQKGVVLEDFAMTSTGTYAFNATGNANYTTNRIKSASGFKTHSGSSGVATLTLIKHDGVFGFDTRGNSFLVTIHSKVTGNLNHLVYVIENSMVNYIQGGVIDGSASGGNGIFVNLSKVTFGNNSAWGYERIRNCTTGINATGVGFVVLTTNIQYSGNTTDENPNGASNPAYID